MLSLIYILGAQLAEATDGLTRLNPGIGSAGAAFGPLSLRCGAVLAQSPPTTHAFRTCGKLASWRLMGRQ